MNEILNQKFGVEVEMYNITRAQAAVVVKKTLEAWMHEDYAIDGPGVHLDERRIHPDGCWRTAEVWKIESDSSIQARNAWERTELVSPVLTWEQMPLLQQIIRNLRAAGARSDPAHQCGVHVHVDGAGHTARSLLNLTNIMASHEQLLIGSIGIAPARMHWCQTVDQNFLLAVNARAPQSLHDLEVIWYSTQTDYAHNVGHYDQTRYHMLNLHSFFEGKGVEFRLFQFDNFNPNAPVGKKAACMPGS